MSSRKIRSLAAVVAALALFACSDDSSPPAGGDAGGTTITDGAQPETGSALPPVIENKVAAIQYGSGKSSQVSSACQSAETPDVCALQEMVLQARKAGANLVVLPENYSIDYPKAETIPKVGEEPGAEEPGPEEPMLWIFSKQAKQLGIYVVVNLLTYKDLGTTCGSDDSCPGTGVCMTSGDCANLYNTSVAFDPSGKVAAVHHKFNLFGGEKGVMTPGNSVASSSFDAPGLGRVGLLVCADIYGSPAMLKALGADVAAVSSYWTVSNSNIWYKTYARNHKVYAVVANTTDSPGYGGGIYAPTGGVVEEKLQTTPVIVYAEIPED